MTSALEGSNYKPEPEHVYFGEYCEQWMERKIPTFSSVTKQRDYRDPLTSRILPHFGGMTFSQITATAVELFIDNLDRCSRAKGSQKRGASKPLSVKRVKHIIAPMTKVWESACNDHNWMLRNPFSGLPQKYAELADRALQEKERQAVLRWDDEEEDVSTREIFLLEEWEDLRDHIDPHYYPALELLMLGMIGSELEALQKRHIRDGMIKIRCAVVKGEDGAKHLKFKPKNWYRKRELPLTERLSKTLDEAMTCSANDAMVTFANDIAIPANQFVLTMKDGSPFNYNSFRKTVWNKALKAADMEPRVPYAARHTLVQWSLLIGVTKTRLVDLMGHSTKKMVDEVYGSYRQGLVEERERILDYLGEDFLALEELKMAFPERYRRRMAMPDAGAETTEAPVLAATFGQSFGQSQGLYPDNYP